MNQPVEKREKDKFNLKENIGPILGAIAVVGLIAVFIIMAIVNRG